MRPLLTLLSGMVLVFGNDTALALRTEAQPTWKLSQDFPTPPIGPPEINGLKYADYPISKVYRGRVILPEFRGREKEFAQFRTRIQEEMRNGPNFAGRYRVIQIGCGGGCRFYIIGDTSTGSLIDFPIGVEEPYSSNLSIWIGQVG